MTKKNDSTSKINLAIGPTTAPSEEDEAKFREAYEKNAAQAGEEWPSFIDSVEELGLPPNEEARSYLNPNDDITSVHPHTKAYQDKIAAALEEASKSPIDLVADDHDDITPT